MKSTRDKRLKLTVCDDVLTVTRLDNHVCLSSSHRTGNQPAVIQYSRAPSATLFGKPAGTILYPVMYVDDVKPDQIFIPPEIADDLGQAVGGYFECSLRTIQENEWRDAERLEFVIQGVRKGDLSSAPIHARELADAVKNAFSLYGNQFPLCVGQVIVVPFRSALLELRIDRMVMNEQAIKKNAVYYPRLSEATQIYFSNERKAQIALNDEIAGDDADRIAEIPLDFTDKGIGGLKNEIALLIRSAFYTRAMKQSWLDAYGIKKHSRGVLLYGPPGTGKTLIAKSISKLFTKEVVHTIEGPELKNKFYGETQKSLGDLFIDARKNPHKLYVYLFDEIDALFSVRGSADSTSGSVNNELVSRFLSILDGPDSPDNVIIIATTNRKELIDPALLRAGRLETHIYIGLPDEKDRLEILRVHTKEMARTLAEDVNLTLIARQAKNYSGAELARLVDVARGYAIGNNFSSKNGKLVMRSDIKSIDDAAKVNQQCFLRALQEVKPMFGVDEEFQSASRQSFVLCHQNIHEVLDGYRQSLDMLANDGHVSQLNYLISGDAGTGKSSLAVYLAEQSGFVHMQVLSAEKLLMHGIARQLEIIDEAFAKARNSSEPGVIILDNLELLMESTPDFREYNNRIRIKIMSELMHDKYSRNKLLVVAATSNRDFIHRIGLGNYFDEQVVLSPIRIDFANFIQSKDILVELANSRGIRIQEDTDCSSVNQVLNITVKDLIYHMQRYAVNDNNSRILKLSQLVNSLVKKYGRQDKCAEAPAVSVHALKAGLF